MILGAAGVKCGLTVTGHLQVIAKVTLFRARAAASHLPRAYCHPHNLPPARPAFHTLLLFPDLEERRGAGIDWPLTLLPFQLTLWWAASPHSTWPTERSTTAWPDSGPSGTPHRGPRPRLPPAGPVQAHSPSASIDRPSPPDLGS